MCRRSFVWTSNTGCGNKRQFASAEPTRTSCACPRRTTCRSKTLTGSWTPSTSIRSRRRSARVGTGALASLPSAKPKGPSRAQLGPAVWAPSPLGELGLGALSSRRDLRVLLIICEGMSGKQLHISSLDTHRATAPSAASPSLPEGLYTALWLSASLQPAHEILRFSAALHR